MVERFTERARTAVRHAVDEARAEGRGPAGTEHLLLGVLADGDDPAVRMLADAGVRAEGLRAAAARHTAAGAAGLSEAEAEALRGIGIDLAAIVARVEESFGPDALCGNAPRPRGGRWSPRARRALALSRREAVRLRHRRIGTGHLLLGLLGEGTGPAAQVLTEAGADLGDLRRRVAAAARAAA